MRTKIEDVMENYESFYVKILNEYYPAKRSAGFTERNQSVNFSKSMEKVHKESFTWFEVPFSEDSKCHIDALIVNKNAKEIFVVEAKRFTNANKKIKDVRSDIERIDDASTIQSLIEELDCRESYDIYGVILADVWTETDDKAKIAELWRDDQDGFFRGTYFSDQIQIPLSHKVEVMKMIDFSELVKNKTITNSTRKNNTIKNYRLLVYIWKTKSAGL